MIERPRFLQRDVIAIFIILMIVIIPVYAYEDSGVEPNYGSMYFGVYKYHIDIDPKNVRSAILKIYLPGIDSWTDECVYTKSIPLQKNNNQIEYQLNDEDYEKINTSWKDLAIQHGSIYQKNNPQSIVIGSWRYEFVIDNVSKGLQNGPEIILAWAFPNKSISSSDYAFKIYLSSKPADVQLYLKYDRDVKYKNYRQISKYSCGENYNYINQWKTIEFQPTDLPDDIAIDGSLINRCKTILEAKNE